MILNRLYELAGRKNLLADPAFETLPVPYVVVLDEGGKFLGIQTRRGDKITKRKTKKGEEVKRTPDKGLPLSVPRPHGNAASQGFARFFVDTLPRILPIAVEEKDRAKLERSRVTFWQQIEVAADATDDAGLRSLQDFGRNLAIQPVLADQVVAAVQEKEPESGDRVTFAYHADGGRLILERPDVRRWYAEYFRQFTADKQEVGAIGFCTITGTVGPLPLSHSMALTGVPGGLPTGAKIVSFDKAAFQHYGLDAAVNAAIGYEAADGYARGFQWLRNEKDHHFTIGGTLFMFWTREDANTDFVMALDGANPEQVKNLLERMYTRQGGDAIDDANDFYLLAVSGNSARVIVREYLERPLGQVRANIAQWFADLRIADPAKEHEGRANAAFPMWQVANATALEADRVSPDTQARLMHAALTGGPLSATVLAACLGRLRAEGSNGFRAPRMGLIKLCLNRWHFREDQRMKVTLDPDEKHPAYVHGRLFAIFEQIQYAALGSVNANVVDKFYGTFSAAPAMVFSRLVANSQNHLRKIRGEKPGAYVNLDRRLSETLGILGAAPPPAQLSLQDQGRFALGYYHEKAKRFEEIADRKAERAAKAEAKSLSTNS